jgi:hypothetical protein
MTVEELRIGNIVLARGSQSVVKSIDENHVGYSKSKKGKWIKRETLTEERVPIKLIQPIPLTEEWLVKFGFEQMYFLTAKINYFIKGNIIYSIIDRHVEYKNGNINFIIRKCKHVHDLQNLYFALTQKELTIKN